MRLWPKREQVRKVRALPSPEEVIDLARRYVVQETVGPLKRLVKVLGFGLLGAVLYGLGLVLALVGVLRLLQSETGSAFYGDWGFAPYLLTAVVGGAWTAGTIAVVSSRLGREERS